MCICIFFQIQKLEHWSKEWIEELCHYAKPIIYEKNDVILEIESSIDEMLFVIEGKLEIKSYLDVSKRKKITSQIGEGSLIGEELIDWFEENIESSSLPISTKAIKVVKQVHAFVFVSDDIQNAIKRYINFP